MNSTLLEQYVKARPSNNVKRGALNEVSAGLFLMMRADPIRVSSGMRSDGNNTLVSS